MNQGFHSFYPERIRGTIVNPFIPSHCYYEGQSSTCPSEPLSSDLSFEALVLRSLSEGGSAKEDRRRRISVGGSAKEDWRRRIVSGSLSAVRGLLSAVVICSLFILSVVEGLFALSPAIASADGDWVSPGEMAGVWDAVAGQGNYAVRGTEAVFFQDGASWTIVGANAPIANPTVYPKKWPVRGNLMKIEVIRKPLASYKILPFAARIEKTDTAAETIPVTAAPGSYATASFIIRSGDVDLKGLTVEVTDLEARAGAPGRKGNPPVIPGGEVDVRLVKCWYQAGIGLGDTRHKTLVPELLLHDDDLVRVDYDRQVNLLRNADRIEDAKTLKPFQVPRHQNKQVWLTIRVRERVEPADYEGSVLIHNQKQKRKLRLRLTVLPLALPGPRLFYGLYYTGQLRGSNGTEIGGTWKSEAQMKAEFIDLKEHGAGSVAVSRRLDADLSGPDGDFNLLEKTLGLMKEVGWGDRPLFYCDPDVAGADNPGTYGKKIGKIVELSKKYGFGDVYIAGADGETIRMLPENQEGLYAIIQEMGARNFAAGRLGQFLRRAPGPDLWVINDLISDDIIEKIAEAKKLGRMVYLNNSPLAGKEDPAIYRNNYGFKMFYAGADGVLDYAYQGDDGGNCWNDFRTRAFRPRVMAYPAVDGPVSTLQWEGWREGVTDVRYLTLLYNKRMGEAELKGLITAFNDPDNLREIIINKILAWPKSGDGL